MDDFLSHRGGLGNDHNSCGNIEEEDRKEHPELTGPQRFPNAEIAGGPDFLLLLRGLPSRRRPPFGRIPVELGRSRHHDQIRDPQQGEGRGQAVGLDHPGGDRAHQKGARPVTAYGEPGNQSPFVRKPLNQDRYGNDVAHPHRHAADHAVGQVENRQRCRQGCQNITQSVQDSGDGGHQTRPFSVPQQSAQDGPETEKENSQGKGQGHFGLTPTVRFHERMDEDAPSINGAEGDLHQDRRCDNRPAAGQPLLFCGHGCSPFLWRRAGALRRICAFIPFPLRRWGRHRLRCRTPVSPGVSLPPPRCSPVHRCRGRNAYRE